MMLRKLAEQDKVLAIIGPHYSSEAEVTFPAGNKIGIVQICTASSKPGVAEANRPWAFRNTLTEDKVAMPVVKTVKSDYGLKKAALVIDVKEAVCASLGKQVFPAAMKAEGVEIVDLQRPHYFRDQQAGIPGRSDPYDPVEGGRVHAGLPFGCQIPSIS